MSSKADREPKDSPKKAKQIKDAGKRRHRGDPNALPKR